MLHIGASEKGIMLLYECDDDFPSTLYIDEQRTRQVLFNLLQNALKYTYQGHIKVSVSYLSLSN